MIRTLWLWTLPLATLALSSVAASAEPIRNGEHRFAIEAEAGWIPEASPTAVLALRGPDQGRVTVSRIDYPNRAAWNHRDRPGFYKKVIDGLARSTPGFRLRRKRDGRSGRVPVLNLAFYRRGSAGKEYVWMRFLFFRTYSLIATSATASSTSRERRLELNRIVDSLTPWFPEP